NLLADPTGDVAVLDAAIEGALKEIKNMPAELLRSAPAPAAPAAAPRPPAPKPTEPINAAVLDKMAAIAEEFLGELAGDIFQNQLADHKLNKDRLIRDGVMKFCYALQKDASMIIGPSAAKQMADKMMLLLK
ncbi:MAG TPA: hypothetical protein VMF29_07195, partial [Candidatus Edwardsbacteria bacterium]|nr:hypothetical protein [Candidatus Edwardsbacteria bacterium]